MKGSLSSLNSSRKRKLTMTDEEKERRKKYGIDYYYRKKEENKNKGRNKGRITKVSEIRKLINCSCNKGTMKLHTIYVDPENGRISLSYGKCSYPFCSHERGLLVFTDMIIKSLILDD